MKLENKIVLYFKNIKEDIILTQEDEEQYRNNSIFRFCEKEIVSDNFSDNCHLNGYFRGLAHQKYKTIVTQNQSNFSPFAFHNFNNFVCQLFLKRLVDKKHVKIYFYILAQTN